MKYILGSRLYAHSHFIGKYDELDKEFFVNFNSTSNLKCIKIVLCDNALRNLDFNILAGKEILTLQRFNLKLIRKNNKLNIYRFNITLRNFFLYFYLELLLYLSFRNKNKVFKNSSEYFWLISELKPFIYSNHKFFYNLNYATFKSTSFLTVMFFKNLNFFKQLNYYYMPLNE